MGTITAMTKARKLNARQRLFVDLYLATSNATQAAKRAGYSEKTAYSMGSDLLRHPEVSRLIAEETKARHERLKMNADDVLLELARIARSDLSLAFNEDGTLKPLQEIPEDVRRCLAVVETDEIKEYSPQSKGFVTVGLARKVKLWDKLRALELLGKNLKLFTDRVEVDVTAALADRLTAAQERLNAAKPPAQG